ncbi:MAG: hypothetical protein R3D83_01185 [Caenibius sp.]
MRCTNGWDRGHQTLLYLNRRGHAPLTLCRHCGYRFQCPNRSAWLVEHWLSQRLACHHCGMRQPCPPARNAGNRIRTAVAARRGTIADEVAQTVPAAKSRHRHLDTLAAWKAAAFIAAAEVG